MKRVLSKLVLVLLLLLFVVLTTGSVRLYTLLIGLAVSTAVALLFEKTLVKKPIALRDAVKLLYLLKYLLHFIYVEMESHIEVAKVILLGKGLRPAIVAIPYSTESDYGTAMVALSITNTPGTVVVHVDRKSKTMFVHWITAKTFEPWGAWEEVARVFDSLAKKVFG